MKKVVIYTGSLCVHCDRAKALLNRKNINFIEYNVAEDSTKRDEMLKKSNGAKKIPQIFIGDYHVGGNLELETLERKGKLDELLEIKPSA